MGGWNTWASCRDGDFLRSGVRDSSVLEVQAADSQRQEYLCRSRDPRLRTTASHACPRGLHTTARLRTTASHVCPRGSHTAARLWYMVT